MRNEFSCARLYRAVFLVGVVPWLGVSAATNEWYPGGSGFSGWPTNWVAVPSLNDPKGDAVDRLDFVGDSFNSGAYWSADSNYFFVRMRMAVSNVTSATYRDSLFVYIDRVGFTNGSSAAGTPDYALAWDSKNNDVTKHGLELMTGTNLAATTYWSQMTLNDIDNSSSSKIAPPDFNLAGDGYIRTVDMLPTTNFGYTTLIDFAVKWSFISANTALGTNQAWRLQFGSRNDANDHNFPQDDIAGGYSPSSVVSNSYSAVVASVPLSAAIDLRVYETSGGVVAELWTVNEARPGDIVICAWLEGRWAEVGCVRAQGEGSNRYTVKLTGLTAGGSYLFKIIDEAGHIHFSPEALTVSVTRIAAVRLEMETLTLSFNTEYGRLYVVKASTNLVDWTVESVSYPTASGPSPYVNTPFTAGPGTQTQVRVPVSGRGKAFFKIERVND